MKYTLIFTILFGWMACSTEKPGDRYPGWQNGEFDIHHIQTGRGESSFLIFPDGTSLLIDAGDYVYEKSVPATPDTSRPPGEWIARYISQVNPRGSEVDYLVISHFHNDHTGDYSKATGFNHGYALAGVTLVGEYIRFKHVYDRGWPNYDYPLPIDDPDVTNYRKFLAYQTETNRLKIEPFQVGSDRQIRLQYDSVHYPSFQVRNIAANGELWTGKGMETNRFYDANPENLTIWPNENTKSIVLRLTYGPFRYYTGGDVTGKLLDSDGNDIGYEGRIGAVCGPVDVCKVNHHGFSDGMSNAFVRAVNAPHYILPVWDFWHIQPSVMTRMINNPNGGDTCRIFATSVPDTLRKQYENEPFMKQLMPETGHIVIKVLNGGDQYKIYVLDNHDESQTIKAIYGPYQAKPKNNE